MRKIIITLITFFTVTCVKAQIEEQPINHLTKFLSDKKVDKEQIKTIVKDLTNDPGLYNALWKTLLDQALKTGNKKWLFMPEINLQFKSFQATDNSPAALGFTYDINVNKVHFKETATSRITNGLGISAKGNVAFNKTQNPTDFSEIEFHYTLSKFVGGVVKSSDDTSVFTRLNQIEDQLIEIRDMKSEAARKLWTEFSQKLVLSNQFYYSVAPKFALECNQDFSKTQYTPGLVLDLGAKAWNSKSLLSKLNILDYPFALLRYITQSDAKITPYGSTLPTVQFAADYVIPTLDKNRESLMGELKPFPRIKFETGFRTYISRINNEYIFFNANFRYYHEINAPDAIKNANLDTQSYLVMALQSSSGLYVSYAKGKLPFDSKTDELFSIGFNFKI